MRIIKADRQILRLPSAHRERIFSGLILPEGTFYLDIDENSTIPGGYRLDEFLTLNAPQFPGGFYMTGRVLLNIYSVMLEQRNLKNHGNLKHMV